MQNLTGIGDLDACSAAAMAALEQLQYRHSEVQQIATWSKSAYQEGSEENVYDKTKNFANDALQNLVYHVHFVGLQIDTFLEVQNAELEKLDIKMRSLAHRIRACKDWTRSQERQTLEVAKPYSGKVFKMLKLEGQDLPFSAQPVPRFVRQPFNLDSLAGASSTLGVSSQPILTPPSINAPPPPTTGGAMLAPASPFSGSAPPLPPMGSSTSTQLSTGPPPPPPPTGSWLS